MRTVFILGGNGGIGRAVVEQFSGEGCKVIAPGSKELDLADTASIDAYMDSQDITADVFVHCAGINNPKPVEQITMEDIDRTHAINFKGFFRIFQRLLPAMKRQGGGHIVALSSIYGSFSRKGRLPYASSKHALNGMIKTMAIELAPHNIMVNTVSPGFVDTWLTHKNNSPEVIRNLESMIPVGRMARPEEIAAVVSFLCSPRNTYLTGQDILVDGGFSAGGFQR